MQLTYVTSLLAFAAVLSGCGAGADSTSSGLSSTTTLMAMKAVGMSMQQPLPAAGCSGSVIPPEKVVDLLNEFPEQQRGVLTTLLNASAMAWSVQMYAGELGMGLCFPAEDVLILAPSKWAPAS